MAAINVHRTGATNALSTGASEGEGWVDLVLNLNQGIEEHRATLLCVNPVSDILRLVGWVVRIGSVNIESLHSCFFGFGKILIKLFGVVYFKDICNITKAGFDIFC